MTTECRGSIIKEESADVPVGEGVAIQMTFYIIKSLEDTTMKKIIIAILALSALVVGMTACGKFTCDLCGEEKTGKKHTEEFLGEELVYCNECYEGMEDVGDALGDLFD